MGFTIRTYTRRAEGQAAEAPTAADQSTGKSKWMVGAKKSISKDDSSPFFGALEVRFVEFCCVRDIEAIDLETCA